jgi:hypothetical protein
MLKLRPNHKTKSKSNQVIKFQLNHKIKIIIILILKVNLYLNKMNPSKRHKYKKYRLNPKKLNLKMIHNHKMNKINIYKMNLKP